MSHGLMHTYFHANAFAWKFRRWTAMNGDNSPVVTEEPVGFEK